MHGAHRTIIAPPVAAIVAITVAVHGALLGAGSYQRTYDAYVHIFFGDHYARDWFSTWETRWYTGFTTTSYPPGTHQLIGALSTLVGLQGAFVVIQLAAVVILVVGVHRFARLWVGEEAARWAALLAVVSSSIAEAVHVFGQLPTTFSLGLLLNALPSLERWMRQGSRRSLLVGVATMAATTAGHHVTTLFGSVFFVGPIVARVLVDELRRPAPGERGHLPYDGIGSLVPLVARRVSRVAPAATRVALTGVVLIVTLVGVVLPYWLWSSSDPISQVPIPHDSRADFLANVNAGLVFWVIPWGVLLLLLPAIARRGLSGRSWPLVLSVGLLFVLGTGGTTPIPRLLLRGAFDILTLDRFTFWATIAVLPLAGEVVHAALDRLGESPLRRLGAVGFAVAAIAAFLFSANLSHYRPLQPDPVDPEPIAEFMAKDSHDRWRYLALGFGDQMAWVSANTTATTVDGNYHSARRLPELVSRPVERLEGAKFRGMPGIGSLQQFVTTPERYSLKFVFSNDTFYDPLLFSNGWHRLGTLRNGVVVWERVDVSPLPARLPVRELPAWQRIMWGVVPPIAIASAAVLQLWAAVGQPLPPRLRNRSGTPTAGAFQNVRPGLRFVRGVETSRPASPLQWTPSGRLLRLLDRLRRTGRLAVGAALICGGLIAVVHVADAGSREPEHQVYDYYDDLDFSRHEAAWSRLDPVARVGLDQFLLERSVTDGLVASYAKLDRIEIIDRAVTGDRARVDVELRYLTSVESYVVARTHELVRRDGVWYLHPDERSETIPPDQFVRRTTVDYLDLGRRQVTAGVTDYGDVLDRPRVELLDSRLVRHEGRWFVVGQITNVDVDPADITVTGSLIGADGEPLVTYQAGEGTVHKVRPGETVPFRIAFEGVAGVDGDADAPTEFEPGVAAELILEAPVVRYEVAVKAVVTSRNPRRLELRDVVAAVDDQTVSIRTGIRNDASTSATLPVVVVTLLDDAGEVAWVEQHYLEDGIRPQRLASFALTTTDPSTLTTVDLPADRYDNGRQDQHDARFAPPATIDLPPGSGYASVRVMVTAFERELTP